jgi:ATP-dependent protease ClpP protease subunit
MTRADLIKKIESERKTRVISYATGDRPPFATKIAGDIVPLLGNLLDGIGKVKKISLLLYTSGGDMLAPIRIVKLIRNHCDEFEVLVPYKAHSAGTLICLGADTIVMGKLGELTPVDPTTGHPFNPQNPANPQQKLEVSVEDLNSYLLFAKEKAEVKSEQMIDAYKLLVEKLHPLSIGNAYRAYRMARLLTERLLWLHMDKEKDNEKIKKIVKEITGDITIHAYPIDRDEAAELGLKIEKATDEIDKSMCQIYENYAEEMKLGQPFHPNELLAGKEVAEINKVGAYLETADTSYQFTITGKAQKIIRNNQPTIDINFESQSWVKKN